MDIRQLWSVNGLFYSFDMKAVPTGIRARITVSSRRTSWETAAMVEMAGRIGLHWAMQEVLPQLKQVKDVHIVEIKARAFQPKKKHLDLVHRFLQELYPNH
ncbi:hypothetical protein [Neobacillus ginsengisoli]|uniref:Uncharacterized protein n=1 Tax=Neobacillus ginsengisoli TaxID=904295 RepID=A0ABT9Y253_9BACI|nr:hypothetical protein [Neobacillus ginsengisoli]MDQ0201904.1 hypothetical protein [Neobacillus ginsengisoli]